ncbi:MAG TPA: metallophosphoesterase family protein [Vicinamibacterales bacterium]|nr:metallophosphoesterase family protein [Vicinamibacterales bacterium]
MRVAAIYDIHGNLPALEAVLEEVRQEDVDHVVVGGDVVPGPMVRETLARLLALDVAVRFIQGNCEVAVLEAMAGRDQPAVPEQHRPIIRWMAQHLQFEYGRLLASWPKTLRLDIDGCGQVLFCHGTPRDDNECFTRLTPEDRLLPIFEGLNASLIVCGHTHMQFDRMIGKTRVVNAGSVGMPFGEPGADWLLLGPDVELRHTNYDGITAAERMRATDYPDAQEFVAQYVLKQPSAAEMLDAFTWVSMP